jgi:hypothetical protein
MDNDALDSVDQFEGTTLAILDGLRRLAPATVQDALAAAIRAGGVALVFRITATSTLSAVSVWLRASERISVSVLGIAGLARPGFGPDIFARCRIDMIPAEIIITPSRAAKGDRWKADQPSFAVLPRNELNDLRAHAHTSHTAIAIGPVSASDIRYAVMPASCGKAPRSASPGLIRQSIRWMPGSGSGMTEAFARQ